MIRKILYILLGILLLLTVFNLSLIRYGIDQGLGQMKIIRNAVETEDLLDDPDYPDSLKRKIHLINEVKRFAVDSLGLPETENYTTLYDQQGKPVLWVISASYPFELAPRTWKFPVVGEVPYKGYFKYEKAISEKEELEALNLDVQIRDVGGWSTLGWFRDPILSEMLSREDGRLAELIIHELTHSVIFVKDSIELNENIASFIGFHGAIKFMKRKYGVESREMKEFERYHDDRAKLVSYVLRGAADLDELYADIKDLADEVKLSRKQGYLEQFVLNFDTVTFSGDRYKAIYSDNEGYRIPNNAYFLSFLRYRSRQAFMENELENNFNGNLKSYIDRMREIYPKS